MAPFGIPTTGFCMVFQYATLVFSSPGTILGTPDPKFGPRLGQGPFSAQNGTRKNMILWNWSPTGFHRDLCEGNGLYGAQEAFGQAHFPPNPTRTFRIGICHFPKQKPWWIPYWPLKRSYRCLRNKSHWHRAHKGEIGSPLTPKGGSPLTPGNGGKSV